LIQDVLAQLTLCFDDVFFHLIGALVKGFGRLCELLGQREYGLLARLLLRFELVSERLDLFV